MLFSKDAYYQEKFTALSADNETIKEKEFEECVFSGCTFLNCRFERCRFLNCQFDHCSLSAINPVNCRFGEVSFSSSKVIGFDWSRVENATGLSFVECQLNYSNFSFLKIPKTKIINSEVKEVYFTDANLSESVFTGSNFEKSIFLHTNLTKANFVGARNYFIDVNNNTVKKAQFSLPDALSLLDSLEIVIKSAE